MFFCCLKVADRADLQADQQSDSTPAPAAVKSVTRNATSDEDIPEETNKQGRKKSTFQDLCCNPETKDKKSEEASCAKNGRNKKKSNEEG